MDSKINFVTGNKGKFLSAKRHLQRFGIEVYQIRMDLPEPRSEDVSVIAREKARHASGAINSQLITNDAGFYIPALNGFPGPYVNHTLKTIGIEGILKLVEGLDRECEFRESVAYWEPGMEDPINFDAVVKGKLSDSPRGETYEWLWSPLGKIFVPWDNYLTLAELSREDYESMSEEKSEENSSLVKFVSWYVKR